MTVNAIGFFAPLSIAVYIMLLLNCFRLGSILDELKKIRRRLDE